MVRSILFIITILLSISPFIHADDIYFKNGNILRNVKITDSTDTYYTVQTSAKITTLTKSSIIKIDIKPITDPFVSLMITRDGVERLESWEFQPMALKTEKKEFPNIMLLPAAISFGVLAADYFDASSTVPDTNKKSKYTAYGILFSISAITVLLYSLKNVSVASDGKSISLSYNF